MSFEVNECLFDGPFATPAQLVISSGIYWIIGLTDDKKAVIVDVGESSTIQKAVQTHKNKDCWEKLRGVALAFAALSMPDSNQNDRSEVINSIRSKNKIIFW